MDEPKDPSLDDAFFGTDDPEVRAFANRQTGRKVALFLVALVLIIGSGVGVGWAIYRALR